MKATIATTPSPPYYAVIFTSLRTAGENDYGKTAERMAELAQQQPGFLGMESVRIDLGITVSYWISEEAIRNWKQQSEHLLAQKRGKEIWYQSFKIRICKVERDYGFEKF